MNWNTRTFFMRCMADFIHGRPSSESVGINWKETFELAVAQSLDGILCYQCRTWLDSTEKRKYLKHYLSYAAQAFGRQKIIEELAKHAEKRGIQLIFMKGVVFQDYYPIATLRGMGDIDCVIREEDREAVDIILRKDMGLHRFIDNHAVWTYWKDTIFLEVHTHMFYENLTNEIDYQGYFDKVCDHCHPAPVHGISSDVVLVPEDEFHFCYLMTHTAKHLINKGSGFRPYLDMVFFVKHCEAHMNWDTVERELRKLQLLEFTRICFGLCERWFDVKMPLKPATLSESFFAKATNKTFDDGVFGLQNRENEIGNSTKEMKRLRLPRFITAILLTWRKLFPAYEDMQLIRWYSFVDGRPWLLPYAWLYRWFYCMKRKRQRGAALLTEPFLKKEAIVARETWLRQWGL